MYVCIYIPIIIIKLYKYLTITLKLTASSSEFIVNYIIIYAVHNSCYKGISCLIDAILFCITYIHVNSTKSIQNKVLQFKLCCIKAT